MRVARATAVLRSAAFVTLAVLGLAGRARADAVSCAATAENAQSLRQKKKLVEAQKQLVACASADCPKFVRADCLRWLDEVQATLPTIVVRASDPSGNDVLEGVVVVDGVPGAALGSAMSLDLGPHLLAVRSGGDSGEQRVLAAEGEKNRIVVVKLEPAKAGAPAATSPAATSPAPATSTIAPDRVAPSASAPGHGPAPWIAGGIGVAGLVTFGVLQVVAQDQYDKLKQSCAPHCEASEVDSLRAKVTLSAVALAVGAVGVGTGIALWFALDPGEGGGSSAAQRRDRRSIAVIAAPTAGGAAATVDVRF